MANQLKMAKIQAILELHQQGWSQRGIASTLQIDRGTVSRYVRRAANAAIPPAGVDAPGAVPNTAIPPAGSEGEELPAIGSEGVLPPGGPGRRSRCEPYRPIIRTKLDQHLSAQRIYQDLVTEHGYTGSYDSVKRFVRRLTAGAPLPMRRVE